jgi:hypothetical protein
MLKKTRLSILTAVLLLTLASGGSASPLFTTANPGVATASNGKMYMVYRGADTRNPNALFWAEFDGTRWKANGMIPGKYGVLESLASPAVVFFDQQIQLVYSGVKSKDSVYWASLDPNTGKWTDHEVVINTGHGDFKVVQGPSVAVLNGTLYMTYQGQEPTYTIYWASYRNGSWTNLMKVEPAP